MNITLQKIAALTGQGAVAFGRFDVSQLRPGGFNSLAPSVTEFFASHVPTTDLALDHVRILSGKSLIEENRDCIPSCFCTPYGFITIASGVSGDAFAFDVTDGKVYLLSHEKYEADGIQSGWNADHTDFLPPLPIDRENIIKTSEGSWDSLSDFLQECFDIATLTPA